MGGESKSSVTYNVYNYYNIGTLKLRKGESLKDIQSTNQSEYAKERVESSPTTIGNKGISVPFEGKRKEKDEIESQYLTTLCGVLCLVMRFH